MDLRSCVLISNQKLVFKSISLLQLLIKPNFFESVSLSRIWFFWAASGVVNLLFRLPIKSIKEMVPSGKSCGFGTSCKNACFENLQNTHYKKAIFINRSYLYKIHKTVSGAWSASSINAKWDRYKRIEQSNVNLLRGSHFSGLIKIPVLFPIFPVLS